MSDYSFMRTGLVGEVSTLSPTDKQTIAAVLCVFCENAMLDAGRAVTLHGRLEVTAEDLIAALKLQAVPSSGFMQRGDLHLRTRRHFEALGEDDGTDAEDGTDGTDGLDTDDGIPDGELLDRLAAAEVEFDNWNPTDPMECCLRTAIVRTFDRFIYAH